eukprot:TRINITY_DN8716_c0_g2_i3.p1 TRINITY_DN8716_c0_g2~~TRINITY_DN8716_c0_g2_i3.p1  ORF type:complete len:773 (+),score=199.48 TRINITY_DN8716_c0_g2_i3:143-2461(+)
MPRRKSQSADLSIDLPQPPAAADLPTAKAASETPENQSNAAPRRTSAIEGRKRRPIWKTLDQIEAERRRGSHTSNASSNSSSMPNDYVAIGMTSADVGQEAYIEVESYMRVIDKEQEEADLRKVKEELETRYVSLANAGRRFFRKQDYHQALKYFRAAIQYSKGVEEERQLPLFRYMGKCFMAVNNIKMAIKAHQRELLLATNLEDISLTGRAYGNIGHALRSGRNFNSAIQAFNKQHDICKMIKDREGQMAALENLGRSFHEVATAWVEKKDGNLSKEYYQQALDRYKQCLKLAVKLRNKPMIGRAYGGIGVVHEQMEEYKQAIAAYKKRLSVAQQLQDTAAQGRALCNMGNVYRALDKTDKALVCYRQDLEIGERLGDTIGMAVTCSNLGHLHQSLGQVDPTIQFLERHVALVTGAAYTHGMIYGLRGLAKVYQAVGRFQDAQACFSKLLALAEELKQTELSKKVLSAMATLEEQMEAGVKISPQEASAALMASAQTESGGMQKKTTRRSPRRKGRRTAPSDQTYSTYSDEGALYSQSSVSHMTQTMELQRLAATQEAQDDDEGHVFEETTAEGEEVDDIGPLRRPGTAGSTRSYVSPKSMRRRLESANDKEAVPGRSARPVGGPPSVHRNRYSWSKSLIPVRRFWSAEAGAHAQTAGLSSISLSSILSLFHVRSIFMPSLFNIIIMALHALSLQVHVPSHFHLFPLLGRGPLPPSFRPSCPVNFPPPPLWPRLSQRPEHHLPGSPAGVQPVWPPPSGSVCAVRGSRHRG